MGKKNFEITVEYNDEYEASDVLESVMGNIDIKNYESIGVVFKIPHWLTVERKDFLNKRGILTREE